MTKIKAINIHQIQKIPSIALFIKLNILLNNLYILTEERAKNDVIEQILELYSDEYNKNANFNNVNI